ncbi:MAG: ribonucleoside-diphosphate reductase subunit alpha [Planctomycetota bacterium]|nr:ribonucleoside-diphosphate reductase subunit alpha [Planctomycetota bacterium]
MRIEKRNGSFEPVDLNKIVRAIQLHCHELTKVDPMIVATRTISGIYDGATTAELDQLAIQTAASYIATEPEYSQLAARMLNTFIGKEVRSRDIQSFSQSISYGHEQGLVNDHVFDFVRANRRKLNDAIDKNRGKLFQYFGLRTVYDRYLLKDPQSRMVTEIPQYFFMRVACGLAETPNEAIAFYNLISSLEYMPSSPTLFNSATCRTQLSSCYLLDSPQDSLDSIYNRYKDIARLSKYAGGIGLSYSRVRAKGSLIRGTNGKSNGIIPFLNTLDASIAAVNQGGRRKGAACVYLETWHADILEFLELRDNTGDEMRRTHNLNIANWVPDLFMQRVKDGGDWSLFDPKDVPHFVDIFGEEFDKEYARAEEAGLASEVIPARDLYSRMMRTLAQTGNGWMTFKDSCNNKANQTGQPNNTIHLSNLCTEILEVTSEKETAVCNLGSINLGRMVKDGAVDFDRIGEIVERAVTFLDRVIDINFYPTEDAATSNSRWRPVGFGMMGLQDVYFKLRMPFDSPEAKDLSARIQEHIYYHALKTSNELAIKNGAHEAFAETRAAKGDLQFDLWGVTPSDDGRFEELRKSIVEHGLRNSLLIAIAPTATIATISGCYECVEPQVSNLFKRETLSGDFIQINNYLVTDLQEKGLWTEEVRGAIKKAEGSIQDVDVIPDEMKQLYRTAWEIPMKSLIDMAADRGAYIDQSQSLNLFMESPSIGKMSSMYMYAWEQGVKTTYYLRSRPATRIRQTDGSDAGNATEPVKQYTADETLACSLENPESCDACE